MKKMKNIIKYLFLTLLIVLIYLQTSIVQAEDRPYSKDGKIYFNTTDTKATTNITWETVGFTITRSPCVDENGGYPLKLKHAIIYLTDNMKKQTDNGDGTLTVKFTIPETLVNTALITAGYSGIKDNDIIYLHGIFKVKHGGVQYGKFKYDLPSIEYAESWRNPKDFVDHFDIKVVYESSGAQPVAIKYITDTGIVISEKTLAKDDWVELGKNVEVDLDKTKTVSGQDYKLKSSYICYLAVEGKKISGTSKSYTSTDLKSDISVKCQQQPGGIQIVAVMSKVKPKPSNGSDTITVDVEEPTPHGLIAADERDNEQFNVEDGIPTTENLYTNVFSNNYLFGYVFTRKYGTKVYTVTGTKTYHLKWTEEDPDTHQEVEKTDTKTVSQSVYISREYSYWQITKIDYYKIDHATVNNYALPNGVSTLTPVGYTVPDLTYVNRSDEKEHMIEPVPEGGKTIVLPAKNVDGKAVPGEDFTSDVDKKIDKIKVRNDNLVFDGTVIMDDNYVEDKTEDPKEIEISYDETEEDVLYQSGQTIDANKANGTYESSGTVTYQPVKTLNPTLGDAPTYSVSDLTDVVIHTPTVCDAYVSNEASKDQMIFPDISLAPLVLDTSFSVLLPTTGQHRDIDGYGYNDYAKYIDSRQVQFPFDVYRGNVYIREGTWVTLNSDETSFYLPIWVDEGKYTIHFRSISINAAANNGSDKTEDLANLELNNYVATDSLSVEVSGRIYGLTLFDISDYPIWENVFRQPNSLKLTGFNYTVGTKNQNGIETGRNSKYTLTLVNGSHPGYSNIGAIKTGYVTRFQLTTIGNMYADQDSINIKPTFYYVDSKGGNRQEVDLYYNETFEGKKQLLVKVGSILDKLNVKAYRLGDTYFSVPESELNTKASVTGKSLKEIKGTKKNLFSFGNMLIRENLRTYIGTNYTPTGSVPTGVNPGKVTKSMQKWYGEYYLPSEIHAVPKAYDVIGYARDHYGIDYKEDFWLKNGYIVVNFNIETIQNGQRHLSYLNLDNAKMGYNNMWKTEGYQYEKTDNKGNVFDFEDGDYILYYTNKSAAADYKSGGTH